MDLNQYVHTKLDTPVQIDDYCDLSDLEYIMIKHSN